MATGFIPLGIPAPSGNSVVRRDCRTEVNTAPNSATPMEPPIERNRVTPDVATPYRLALTVFCTASTSTCMTIPNPIPSTAVNTYSCQVGESMVIRVSKSMPIKPIRVPTIG